MRIVVAAALLSFTVPAWAQAPAPPTKPSAPAAQSKKPPATNTAKNGYDALSLAERATLQFDLIWTGDFNGIADGVWSERSLAAVKAYQKRKGGKESGALTDEERAALAAAAKAKQDEVGWRIVNDDSGARLGVPGKLVPQSAKGKSGGHWQSARGEVQIDVFRERAPATLRIVYDHERKNPARKIEYNVLRPDFFVISGLQGLKKFYMRAQASGNEVRGVLVRYDQAVEGIMDPVVVAISGAFTPFPSAAQAGAGPASKRMVEYGSGVIVGASGEIVTDRDTVDGCQTVVAAGIGNADRVSDDQQSGLALLRVYGVRELKPLALGAAPGADIVLVGIADPQSQDGKAAISTVKVRVQASGGSPAIDPPPPPGLAGAAAIDAEAGFVGIAVRRPQVVAGPASGGAATVLAPVDAIRRLLGASGAAATSGRASVDFAKDSVIRVICVRK